MAGKRPPIDPGSGPTWALSGRVVTMDGASTVLDRGVVYIAQGTIAAVLPADAPPPHGFETVAVTDTGGTILPGLIELHNHVAYNALRLWQVPRLYSNRDQWGGSDDYHRLVTAPMKTVGDAHELLPALARYVEVKALLGGVTTTQGIALFSAPGNARYYRGIVRNVEQTDDPHNLPAAGTRIADVDARDPQKFLAELGKHTCFLLHLSEGTDQAAHDHFQALQIPPDQWAITPALAGIHCAALQAADFQLLAEKGASMVWSPLSNLLLYGQTARIADAKAAADAHGTPLKIGLGSDWSPSGSKSLFGELKAARVYSRQHGGVFSDAELLALGTINGAEILGWQRQLGSLEATKRADLLVVAGQDGDAHAAVFGGDERSVQLVVINGVPRYGTPALMAGAAGATEALSVGGEPRELFLAQANEDPDVAAIPYAKARDTLADALLNIKTIRLEQEANAKDVAHAVAAAEEEHPRLLLDEFEFTGFTQRPHLSLDGVVTGPLDKPAAKAPVPISSLLEPLTLDVATVADDADFLTRLAAQPNLPGELVPALRELYKT